MVNVQQKGSKHLHKTHYFWTRQTSSLLRPKDLHSFSNPSYETEGEKTKTLKKIPLPGEIPSLKESEIGFIPKGVPTITGNQSGQATGHGCRPLTRKLCSTLTKNQNPGPWTTQRNRRTHRCSRSLFYSELFKHNSQMILGREFSIAPQRWEENFRSSSTWVKKISYLDFGSHFNPLLTCRRHLPLYGDRRETVGQKHKVGSSQFCTRNKFNVSPHQCKANPL